MLRRALALWVPSAVIMALTTVMVYGATQQDLRQSANDPQRAMALEAAARLDAGASPSDAVGATKVEMAWSLTPFIMVLDGNGKPLVSGATLDGHMPQPPNGLGAEARARGRHDVTWQPRPGVRSAAVVVPWAGGAVVAARSLQAVEEREHQLLIDLLLGGLLALTCIALACLAAARLWPTALPPAAGIGQASAGGDGDAT